MPVEFNQFDDERLAQVRSEQGDTIIQYFIVRTDIAMSTGKIGAQIAHGAEMFILEYERRKILSPENSEEVDLTTKWLNGSFRKVILGGKKKDFERIKLELNVFLVRDAGLTEVEPNTETVIACWPMLKSSQPKGLSRLQTLK